MFRIESIWLWRVNIGYGIFS
ncbi:Protein of unknown function [Pyronema omphalodes CBS 100304]|uniref:Uncharacterized protein n=1 Tax=Pyronema omphalodes (strain CBS 100304) TaxID=1076935 RepID=U4LTU8_PYROM|nr:Protein of unknown function [Pyronema omphalodes CBS 100304]